MLLRERWGHTDDERMARLARAFPSLAEAAGIAPWNLAALLRWAMTTDLSPCAMHAVRFLLHVLDDDKDWRVEAARLGFAAAHDSRHRLAPFGFAEAFRDWDEAHRAAVIAWCEAPFHP